MNIQRERDSYPSKTRSNEYLLKHQCVLRKFLMVPKSERLKNKCIGLLESYLFCVPKNFYGLLRRTVLQSSVWDSFNKEKWRTTMIRTYLIFPDINEFWEQRSNKQYLCLYADIHKKAKWWYSSKFFVWCKLVHLWLQWNAACSRLCIHSKWVWSFMLKLWRFLPLILVETKSNPV